MTQESTIRALLEDVRAGRVSVDDAQAALRALRARAEEFQVRQVYLTEPYQPGSRRKG